MNKRLFKTLADHNYILVSGPQRSGTTFAAAALAHSLERRFCPDEIIGQDEVTKLNVLIRSSPNFVLQCPALFWCLDSFQDKDFPNTAVVVMKRSLTAINKSVARIDWDGAAEEIDRYRRREEFREDDWQVSIEAYQEPRYAIGSFKYYFWDTYQKDRMQLPFYELDYNSLRWHPRWENKVNRKDFEPRQVSLQYKNAIEENL